MSEISSNQPEGAKPQLLSFSIDHIDGKAYLADLSSQSIVALDDRELEWLREIIVNPDGVTLRQLRGGDTIQSSARNFVELRAPRDSLVDKVNTLFDQAVLEVTCPFDEDIVHVAPGYQLEADTKHYLQPAKLTSLVGHPSTIDEVAARALRQLSGMGESREEILESQARVEPMLGLSYPRRPLDVFFSDAYPALATKMYQILAQTHPALTVRDIDWMTDGACVDGPKEIFAAPYKHKADLGKLVCANCIVAEDCYGVATANEVKGGVWGGMDPKERKDKEFSDSVRRVWADIVRQIPDSPEQRRLDIAAEASRWLQLYLDNLDQSALKGAQVPAFRAMAEHFAQELVNPDGFVTMPTGAGKTVLFIEFIRAVGLKTIVLVPTQQLVHQTVSEFADFHEEGNVGKIYAHSKDTGHDITVTTYQSFIRHVTRQSGMFDLASTEVLVLDEAHKSLGARSYELLSTLDHVVKIGFTATDEYDPTKTLSDIVPNEIYRMDIPEAIDAELIAPYQTIFVDTESDLSKVRISSTTKDYDEHDLADAVDNLYRNELAALFYNAYFSGQKAVFFCASVKHAKAVATELQSLGFRAEAVYGDQPEAHRQRILEDLDLPIEEGGLEVVCNAKLLTEGWDNPRVGVCFNLAPTLSKVVAKQRAGRTLRVDSNQPDKVARIVEFIDRNPSRAPATFPDPEVAKRGAYFGANSNAQSRLLNIAEAGITTDPGEVQRRAYEMNHQRRRAAGLPPYDWVSAEEVVSRAIYATGLNQSHIRSRVRQNLQIFKDDLVSQTNELLMGTDHDYTFLYSPGQNRNMVMLSPQAAKVVEEYYAQILAQVMDLLS